MLNGCPGAIVRLLSCRSAAGEVLGIRPVTVRVLRVVSKVVDEKIVPVKSEAVEACTVYPSPVLVPGPLLKATQLSVTLV
jgi:hypothetical protein